MLSPGCRRARVTGLSFLFAFISAAAQIGQNGSISGRATTADGEPVSQATVALTGTGGLRRVTVTQADGSFSFQDLSSGSYAVHVIAGGLSSETIASVPVAVGRVTQLPVQMVVASVSEGVTVLAAPQTFDTGQTSSVVNIDRDRVEELPIPNRNYLTFVGLSPQATPANPALAQQTGVPASESFGFGGLRPTSNAIRIDGAGDDDEYTGSSRTQLSPEAISDFQIVNHGFAAESGGGAGGSIDVQTRVGNDRVHGDAFTFVQNGALNATPPLERVPRRPDESRLRAGLSAGGPLQPGKTFYYVAAEQETAHGEDATGLAPETLGLLNAALQNAGPLRALTLASGFFPTTNQETEASVRLDRVLTPRETLTARYAFTNARQVNDAFHVDELSDRTARGSSFVADNSVNGTLRATFTSAVVNSLSGELAQRRAEERTASNALPGIWVPGTILFGTPYFGNTRRFEMHAQLEDELLRQGRHHLVQAGAGLDRVALRASVLDGQRGLFIFPALASVSSGAADFFTQTFLAQPNTKFAVYRSHAFLQDHWTPLRGLAVDYGLRYEQNHLPAGLPQHPLNLSPRFGLAWSPTQSLIVRSGFGIFYDRFLLSTVDRLLQLDGTHGFTQTLDAADAAALYRSGSAPVRPLPGIAPSVWRAQPGLRNPYSEVASLSAEQALPLQTTLKAEFQYVHGVHLGRTVNSNLLPPAPLPVTGAPPGTAAPVAFSPLRIDPGFDAINQFSTSAGSIYNGATITLNRQFTDDLQLLAGYTFSKTIDDASFDTEQPQNPYALRDERALSLQDQRHRLTLSGLWLIGPDLNDAADAVAAAHPGTLLRLLTGLEFAPILSVSSGFRANPVTGTDSTRQHIYPFAARPVGYARNSLATPPIVNFDLRVLKATPVRGGHLDVVAESFNLLNHRNVSLLDPSYGLGSGPATGFGAAIATSSARRVQFSLDYEF